MIDVSLYQGHVDWKLVSKVHRVAAIKACEGLYENDSTFSYNRIGAKSNGMIACAYFFAHPSESVKAQAHHFIDIAYPLLTSGNGLPILDIEVAEGYDTAELETWVDEWFSIIDPIIHTKAVLYSYTAFFDDELGFRKNPVWLRQHSEKGRPLWVADYARSLSLPSNVNRAQVYYWQFSQTGKVFGINGSVDLSYRYAPIRKIRIPRPVPHYRRKWWN